MLKQHCFVNNITRLQKQQPLITHHDGYQKCGCIIVGVNVRDPHFSQYCACPATVIYLHCLRVMDGPRMAFTACV